MDMLTNQAKICSSPHETCLVIKLTKILKIFESTPNFKMKISEYFHNFGIIIAIIPIRNSENRISRFRL